ncbi:MAG: hypothetical protein OXF74_08510 [Rhodobacteraceae bacterium]|nr:hypothetical protein [Paracoccaceae bacterium]
MKNELHNVQYTRTNITENNPMINRYLNVYNDWRPHDAFDGVTLNQYLESRRISESRQTHM